MLKNRPYNFGHQHAHWSREMPKQKNDLVPGMGARLAALRKAAGYTQTELGEELGVSQRVIAYYEGETDYPPSLLLPGLAKALKVTTDELLGIAPMKKAAKPGNSRLQRRIQDIEKLDARQKRQIMQFLDTFIENEKLKRKAPRAQPRTA